jgi:hypothetical protein
VRYTQRTISTRKDHTLIIAAKLVGDEHFSTLLFYFESDTLMSLIV